MSELQIAIDGPAGSGKSTISKIIANKLNISYLDTGAMYRAVTLKLIQEDIDLNNIEKIKNILDDINIDFDGNQIYLNGKNVTTEIRKPKVTKNVSKVASYQFIRKKMVNLQRKISENKGVVMDGRDIGTHVLPNADYKIYLNATVEERARRRYLELLEDNQNINFKDIINEIKQRDKNDMNREHSPLKKAEDAIEINTTGLSIEEVVNQILGIIGD